MVRLRAVWAVQGPVGLVAEGRPVEGLSEHGQDRPVCRSEPGMLDLALQDQDLMAKGEDLRVTLVTGHEQ